MQEWVILQNPGVLLTYGGGLCCFLLDKKWRVSKGILTWIGGALAVCATAWLILSGGSLWEAAAWLAGMVLILMEGKA